MLQHLLSRAVEIYLARPIIECVGFWTRAAELDRLVSRPASGLVAMGLETEDRVAPLLPNGFEAIVGYLACFRMRLVSVPLDYQYYPLHIDYGLVHSGAVPPIPHHERLPGLEEAGVLKTMPRVVVVAGETLTGSCRPFESLLGADGTLPASAPHDDAPAVMIYTAGTTARPKGVVLSHGALFTGIRKYLARVACTADDVALITSSISRQFTLRCQLLPTLRGGRRGILFGGFVVKNFVDALRRPPAKTFLTVTPAGLGLLMANPDFQACDFGQLRLCLTGGDRPPPRFWNRSSDSRG